MAKRRRHAPKIVKVGLALAGAVLALPLVVVIVSRAQTSRSLLPQRLAEARSLGLATTHAEVLAQHGSGVAQVDQFLQNLKPKTEAWRARTKNYRDAELAKLADDNCDQILLLEGKKASYWLSNDNASKDSSAVASIGIGLGLPDYQYKKTAFERARAQSILISWCLDQHLEFGLHTANRLLKSQQKLIQQILNAKLSNGSKAAILRRILDLLPSTINFAHIRSAECGQYLAKSIRDGFDFIQVDGPGGHSITLSTLEKLQGVWFDTAAGSFQSRCGQTAWLTQEMRESLLSDYLAAEVASHEILKTNPTDPLTARRASVAYSSQLSKTNWLMADIAQTYCGERSQGLIDVANRYLTGRALLDDAIRQLEGRTGIGGVDFDDKSFRRIKKGSVLKIYSIGQDQRDDGAPENPNTRSDDFGFNIPMN